MTYSAAENGTEIDFVLVWKGKKVYERCEGHHRWTSAQATGHESGSEEAEEGDERKEAIDRKKFGSWKKTIQGFTPGLQTSALTAEQQRQFARST